MASDHFIVRVHVYTKEDTLTKEQVQDIVWNHVGHADRTNANMYDVAIDSMNFPYSYFATRKTGWYYHANRDLVRAVTGFYNRTRYAINRALGKEV